MEGGNLAMDTPRSKGRKTVPKNPRLSLHHMAISLALIQEVNTFCAYAVFAFNVGGVI
jgi:hypothetical protein